MDPTAPVPPGLLNPDGSAASKRFDVYRNNVTVSLCDALAVAFPVLKKLLGDNNFGILAKTFVRQHPPSDPVIALYGHAMPTFLEGFEPVRSLPYLADIARLELAIRRSYHAADSAPADLNRLDGLAPDELMRVCLTLAPSAIVVRSAWPIHAIWRANTQPDAPKVKMAAEDVLVVRPEFDPEPHLLPAGGGAFVDTLSKGSLGDAVEAAQIEVAEFDLTNTLGLLIAGQAITDIA